MHQTAAFTALILKSPFVERGATMDRAGRVYLFYATAEPGQQLWGLASGYSMEFWTPKRLRIWPAGLPAGERKHFALRWVLHTLHLFSHRQYGALIVRHRGKLVHYAGVRPKYWRFPFMAPADIQIGDTWTDPEHRGKGIARYVVQEIVKTFGMPGRRFWYVVEATNTPSIKVAESTGMTMVAKGGWTRSPNLWPSSSLSIHELCAVPDANSMTRNGTPLSEIAAPEFRAPLDNARPVQRQPHENHRPPPPSSVGS
jgi:RimJ/RimL family protein N-acetyltransferase